MTLAIRLSLCKFDDVKLGKSFPISGRPSRKKENFPKVLRPLLDCRPIIEDGFK